jgi:hypothetical protein
MRHDPGFAAVLEITLGGRREVVASDSSWLSVRELSFGVRAQAWASIEEHINARKTTDWTRPDLTLPHWNPSVVLPDSQETLFFPRSTPLQIEKERPWSSPSPALPIELYAGNEIELTLPEITQAFHLLEMDAGEGSSLEVSYVLPEGQRSGRCTYIARSGVQTWMGGDTFAFVKLRLRMTAGRIRLTRASAYEVRYPFQRTASFTCNDPFLSQLWGICARSLEDR